MKRIIPALGHIRLSKLQPHHILEYLQQLEEPGQNKKTGAPLSAKTISNHLRIISSIFATAAEWQIIPLNPARSVRAPKRQKHEIKFLDDVQTVQLLQALEGAPLKYRAAIELLLFSGARRGEVLALRWHDISYKDCTVNISKALLYLPERGVYEDSPKTESSNRVVKIPQDVIAHLRQYRAEQSEEQLQFGDLWQGVGYVFTQSGGHPLRPDTLSGWFRKFIRRYNAAVTNEGDKLPEISIHGLRHTNASLLIASGANIRTVAARLGHAQTSTTTNIYAHAIKSADAIASDALEAVLLKKNG